MPSWYIDLRFHKQFLNGKVVYNCPICLHFSSTLEEAEEHLKSNIKCFDELNKHFDELERDELERKQMSDSIQKIQLRCHQIAKAKGFWDTDRNYGEMIALMHSELSELMEAYRKFKLDSPSDHCPELTCQEEEMADLLIRMFDLAEHNSIDLAKCIKIKSDFNEARSYMHGKKC